MGLLWIFCNSNETPIPKATPITGPPIANLQNSSTIEVAEASLIPVIKL